MSDIDDLISEWKEKGSDRLTFVELVKTVKNAEMSYEYFDEEPNEEEDYSGVDYANMEMKYFEVDEV